MDAGADRGGVQILPDAGGFLDSRNRHFLESIQVANNYPTISDAARLFAESLGAAQRAEAQEALRFARWFGDDRPAIDLRAPDVGSYVESFGASAPNAMARAEALKLFLAYAHKQKLVPDRLVSHVRVRKGTLRPWTGAAVPVRRAEVHLTAEGRDALASELEALKAQRPRVASDLRDAMADKDFRENAPLDAAREAQGQMEARIRELEATLRGALILGERASSGVAHIGSNVVLANLASGVHLSYLLVSPAEARPTAGRLSVESPVGRAVIGHGAGEEVEVAAPSGTVRFRIENVSSQWG